MCTTVIVCKVCECVCVLLFYFLESACFNRARAHSCEIFHTRVCVCVCLCVLQDTFIDPGPRMGNLNPSRTTLMAFVIWQHNWRKLSTEKIGQL